MTQDALSLAQDLETKLSFHDRVILVLYAQDGPALSTMLLADLEHVIPADKAAVQYKVYCSHSKCHNKTFDLADAEAVIYNGRRNCLNKTIGVIRKKGYSCNVKVDGSPHRGRKFQGEDGRIYHLITEAGKQRAEEILNENI